MSSASPPLMIGGFKQSEIGKCTIPLSNSISLRIYSGTQPRHWKIAGLQKGLILVYKGVEMVGEGTGFGVPVLLFADNTYFSATSRLCAFSEKGLKTVHKVFFMDTVQRKRIRGVSIEDKAALALLRYTATLYRRYKGIRPLLNALKKLNVRLGLRTTFDKTRPVGEVRVAFSISPGSVDVKVDLCLLKKEGLKGVVIFNEQGSRFLRRYTDSLGADLIDGEIGAWERVEAEWACLTDPLRGFGFRLYRVKNSVLRRGQEFRQGEVDWVGLDYEINPESDHFEYGIEFLGVD